MHINAINLINFKRFSDLTISEIPDNCKLVLLIGANGSGKSSVFDAFEAINSWIKEGRSFFNDIYYKKAEESARINIEINNLKFEINEHDHTIRREKFNFYGRTSFRQVSRMTRKQLGSVSFDYKSDSDRPRYFIDRDIRFENDLEHLIGVILRDVFIQMNFDKIKELIIEPINRALENIFGLQNGTKLQLVSIVPPLDDQPMNIEFLKGNTHFHYNQLSAGEKEVFNLLINYISRRELYENAIVFLDEIDLHLHTELQFRLLKEITENWIPDSSQLWISSHSLGFIDYARQYERGCIIDFDNLDFDAPYILKPQPKDNLDVFEIALPKSIISKVLKGKTLVICENQNDEYYNLINIKDTIFVGVNGSRDVFLNIKRDSQYHSLRDRDFISDDEIGRLKKEYPNHHILGYYDFENYLYHPDNIAELNPPNFNKADYIMDIIAQKNNRLRYILMNVSSSRLNYEEFKTNDKFKDKDAAKIADDLSSDEFEVFYKFFDMKVQYNKSFISAFNLKKTDLVQTKWFKNAIEKVLK